MGAIAEFFLPTRPYRHQPRDDRCSKQAGVGICFYVLTAIQGLRMRDTKWLQFLRHYGPIPRNDNVYDETIQRSARRQKIAPIEFEHPMQDLLLRCFDERAVDPVSVILTGTAGDGKTHLCRKVWARLNG